MRRHLSRQERSIASLVGALKNGAWVRERGAPITIEDIWFEEERWDRELTQDLEGTGLNGDSAVMARKINEMTKLRLSEALTTGADMGSVFRWDEEVLDG